MSISLFYICKFLIFYHSVYLKKYYSFYTLSDCLNRRAVLNNGYSFFSCSSKCQTKEGRASWSMPWSTWCSYAMLLIGWYGAKSKCVGPRVFNKATGVGPRLPPVVVHGDRDKVISLISGITTRYPQQYLSSIWLTNTVVQIYI
jgi:hypothetical protein